MKGLDRANALLSYFDLDDEMLASLRASLSSISNHVPSLMKEIQSGLLSDEGVELFFDDDPDIAARFRSEMTTFALKAGMCMFNENYCQWLAALPKRVGASSKAWVLQAFATLDGWLTQLALLDDEQKQAWSKVIRVNCDLLLAD